MQKLNVRGLEGNDLIDVGGDPTSGPNALLKPVWIWGGSGNDRILGSQGYDKIHADDGNDIVYGRGGNDTIDGDLGDDFIDGGNGNDHLRGGDRNDTLRGGNGNDRLEGGNGNDHLYGGNDNDTLDGGIGTNYLAGEAGNDTLYSRSLHDTLDGGTGHDVAYFLDAAAPRSTKGSTASPIRNVEDFNHPAGMPASLSAMPGPFDAQVARLIQLTNAYRVSKGLAALTVDTRLVTSALYQSQYMARTGHYDHTNLDGRGVDDRVWAAGYRFSFIAENIHLYDPAIRRTFGIDRVYQPSELAQYYFDGWKVSPSHNANLLSSQVRDVGVAMVQDRVGRIYVTMDLGRP